MVQARHLLRGADPGFHDSDDDGTGDLLGLLNKLDHLADIVDAAHARDMRVIADLVMNHTSDRHAWFQIGGPTHVTRRTDQ